MLFGLAATSQSVDIRVVDDDGLAVTGLVAATFPVVKYSLAGANSDVTITLADLALITTSWASGGVKERGNGVYRLDVPNAAFTTAGRVTIRGEDTDKHIIVAAFDVGMLVPATVTVTPTSTTINDRVTASTITCYYGEAGFTIGPNVVTDANGDPINLSTSYTSLRFTVQDQYGTDLLSTTSVTVSGASSNQWTVTGTSAVTVTAPAKLHWSLRGISTGVDVVLGLGQMLVVPAAKVDS